MPAREIDALLERPGPEWRRREADLRIGAHAGGGNHPAGMDGDLFGISEP